MTTSNVYYLHGILSGATLISQLEDASPDNSYQDLVEWASGQAAPQFSGSGGAVPHIPFSTKQITDLLGLIDTENIAADLSGGNVDLHYKRGDAHGIRTADASLAHIRARLTSNALLYWTGFRAAQGESAVMQCRLLPTYDGSNNPIIWATGLALAGTSVVSHLFTLGKVDINGTDIASVTELSWENNITPEEIASDGEEFISYAGINTYSPQITFRSRDTTLMSTLGAKGTAITSLEVYLRKRTAGGINVADNVAQHIKFTATSGAAKARRVQGTNGLCEVFLQLNKPDATTNPFTVSTASAIT